jgi:hypothetical protein
MVLENGFGERADLERAFPISRPILERVGIVACGGIVMRQQREIFIRRVAKQLFAAARDALMQLAAGLTQQRLISRILRQDVFEKVHGLGFVAGTKKSAALSTANA